jgi:hypothetical protein
MRYSHEIIMLTGVEILFTWSVKDAFFVAYVPYFIRKLASSCSYIRLLP